MKDMSSKMMVQLFGVVLVLIALVLGGAEYFGLYDFTQVMGRHLYVYGLFGIIGLIGIIMVAWAFMKKENPPATQ
jgi:hypothetical protein